MDKIIYKSIIIGIDHTKIVGINIPQVIKNKKRSSFPFHLKCLNLKEKKGISETNMKDIIIINGTNTEGVIIVLTNSPANE
jgi:hypothetical protein